MKWIISDKLSRFYILFYLNGAYPVNMWNARKRNCAKQVMIFFLNRSFINTFKHLLQSNWRKHHTRYDSYNPMQSLGGQVFQQRFGIPMVTYCALFLPTWSFIIMKTTSYRDFIGRKIISKTYPLTLRSVI